MVLRYAIDRAGEMIGASAVADVVIEEGKVTHWATVSCSDGEGHTQSSHHPWGRTCIVTLSFDSEVQPPQAISMNRPV